MLTDAPTPFLGTSLVPLKQTSPDRSAGGLGGRSPTYTWRRYDYFVLEPCKHVYARCCKLWHRTIFCMPRIRTCQLCNPRAHNIPSFLCVTYATVLEHCLCMYVCMYVYIYIYIHCILYISLSLYLCVYIYIYTRTSSCRHHVYNSRHPDIRKGGWYGWKPSSSSNLSIRVFRAYPLIEIRQTGPRRAIRGNGISVSSTLPLLLDMHHGCGQVEAETVEQILATARELDGAIVAP